MNDFYKMDAFFFVTTIGVVLFSVVAVIAGIYLIKILKDIKYISAKAKSQSDLLAEDLRDLRANVREKGFKIKHFFDFFSRIYKKRK